MRIKCKCGRVMNLDPARHAGRKVSCSACGQRYRMPPTEPRDPTIPMKPWVDNKPDSPPVDPNQVGARPLGERVSFAWILFSLFFTLVIVVGGAYGGKVGLKKALASEDLERYRQYIWLAAMWVPVLAFVLSGWITARFSPGRTIAEPAVGSILAVAAIFALAVWRPGPVDQFLGPLDVRFAEKTALKANLFGIAMFVCASLSLTGAYFGEVAQLRASEKR